MKKFWKPGLLSSLDDLKRDLRVLVLEDNAVDLLRIRRLLSLAGRSVECEETTSLAGFQSAVRKQTYDLFLIDYRLPDGTGLDALRSIRQRDPNVALLSGGLAPVDLAISTYRQGATYIEKSKLCASALADLLSDACCPRDTATNTECGAVH